MIRHNPLNTKWFLLHPQNILHITEHALNNPIVIRFSLELGADELFHLFAGFGCVVSLMLCQ